MRSARRPKEFTSAAAIVQPFGTLVYYLAQITNVADRACERFSMILHMPHLRNLCHSRKQFSSTAAYSECGGGTTIVLPRMLMPLVQGVLAVLGFFFDPSFWLKLEVVEENLLNLGVCPIAVPISAHLRSSNISDQVLPLLMCFAKSDPCPRILQLCGERRCLIFCVQACSTWSLSASSR